MDFGSALKLIKAGKKVCRANWNGQGMYVYLQECSTIYPGDSRNAILQSMSGPIHIKAHIDMKAADGSIVIGWLASQTDLLSDDWKEVK